MSLVRICALLWSAPRRPACAHRRSMDRYSGLDDLDDVPKQAMTKVGCAWTAHHCVLVLQGRAEILA